MSLDARSLRVPQAFRVRESPSASERVRASTHLEGMKEFRERIACALCTETRSVIVDHYRYNASRVSAQCLGTWNGRRFFAKILLADPYPVPPRFTVPWEASPDSTASVRAVGKQIETEWEMACKMRAFSNGSCVPAPLGKSVPGGVIVWEEARGTRLDHAIKWSRWKRPMAEAGAEALFRAGKWLRKVHGASQRGTEIVRIPTPIRIANDRSRKEVAKFSHFDRVAAKILESSILENGGKRTFRVPVAFTHGDFCLANLLWDNGYRRLSVFDFELSGFRPICHDLFALVSNLRSQLLNPLIPKPVILSWEKSFWWGYGPISSEVMVLVKALALTRVFQHHLSRIHTRRERKGWIAGISAQVYRVLLEPGVIAKRLDLPEFLEDRSG